MKKIINFLGEVFGRPIEPTVNFAVNINQSTIQNSKKIKGYLLRHFLIFFPTLNRYHIVLIPKFKNDKPLFLEVETGDDN